MALLAPLVLLGCAKPDVPTAAAEPVDELAARAGELLAAYHERTGFSGVALLASGDDVRFVDGIGDAVREFDVPNTAETRFRIGSVTKQFTAALVMQLVEEGLVDLEAPIVTWLPDYPRPQGERITPHQLLTHTSGIPNYTAFPEWRRELMYVPRTPAEFMEVFWARDLEFEPGSQYRYSNSGYFVLGAIVEAVTGESYADALDERLLVPLGLDDTGYERRTRVVPRLARGYYPVLGEYRPESAVEPSLAYAAGMLYSTAPDLHRWTRALLAGEPFDDPATLQRMLTPHGGGPTGYAYGLERSEVAIGEQTVAQIGHTGRIEAFVSQQRYLPDDGWTVIALSNTVSEVGAVADDLVDLAYGVPVEPPRRPIQLELSDRIAREGIDAAVARYREVRAAGGEGFDTSEDQLNQLGYNLLAAGDVAAAVAIFELNVEAFPEASNPYDSLGEGYLAAGDLDRAEENYRRSLELDPANANAERMLERIAARRE